MTTTYRLKTQAILLGLTVLLGFAPLTQATADAGKDSWYNPTSWWYNSANKGNSAAVEKSKSEIKAEKRRLKAIRRAERRAKREESKRLKALERGQKKSKKARNSVASGNNGDNTGAIIETAQGNIIIRLYPKDAPITVKNFKTLVGKKFYNQRGMKFHRVVPGFVIQTGDPTGTGYGGSDKKIPLEVKNKLYHDSKGVVAMARGATPNTATSQFYITLDKQTSLDGKYAIFGRVVEGLDVVDKIKKNDAVYGIRLVDLSRILNTHQTQKPQAKKFYQGNPFKRMVNSIR